MFAKLEEFRDQIAIFYHEHSTPIPTMREAVSLVEKGSDVVIWRANPFRADFQTLNHRNPTPKISTTLTRRPGIGVEEHLLIGAMAETQFFFAISRPFSIVTSLLLSLSLLL